MLRRFVIAALSVVYFALLPVPTWPATIEQGQQDALKPGRKWLVYLLPHSHKSDYRRMS
jgi:hypothetical protein